MKIDQIIAVLQALKDDLMQKEVVRIDCFPNKFQVKTVEMAKDFTVSVGSAGEEVAFFSSGRVEFDPSCLPNPKGKGVFGKRQSGRTQRMINEAMSKADAGKHVTIVAANFQEEKRIAGIIKQFAQRHGRGHGVMVVAADSPHIDWERMKVRSCESLLLVDHYAIETKFRKVLEMLRRWDA